MFGKLNPHIVKETAISGLVALLIYYVSVSFLPFIIFAYPVPFVLMGVKRGYEYSGIAQLLAFAGVYILDGLSGGVLMAGLGILVAFPMIYALRRGYTAFQSIATVTVICLVAVMGLSFLVSNFKGVDILSNLETSVRVAIDEQVNVIKQLNIDISIEEFKSYMESGVDMMLALLPSLLFILSMVVAMLNYYASTGLLRRIGFGIIDVPKFRNFRLPKDILRGSLLMIIGVFVLDWFGFGFTTELSLNLTLVFSFLFLMQGLAVTVYLLGIRFKSATVFLFVVLSLLLNFRLIYVVIGALDTALDFRNRLGRNRNE